MKYIILVIATIVLFLVLHSCAQSTSEKIGAGLDRDLQRETSMENSDTYINPDDPI
jgi:hypothetical protein